MGSAAPECCASSVCLKNFFRQGQLVMAVWNLIHTPFLLELLRIVVLENLSTTCFAVVCGGLGTPYIIPRQSSLRSNADHLWNMCLPVIVLGAFRFFPLCSTRSAESCKTILIPVDDRRPFCQGETRRGGGCLGEVSHG